MSDDDAEDAPGLRALAARPRRFTRTTGAGSRPRNEWVALAVEGQITETLYGLSRVRTGGRHYTVAVGPDDAVLFEGDDGALYLATIEVRVHAVERTASGDVVPFSASSLTTTPSTGFDTCRHQHAQRVHPHYEIQESGYAPED